MPAKIFNFMWPLITAIIFIFAILDNYLIFMEFDRSTVSRKYGSDEISPATWTFTIWWFIYAWQAVWIIYVMYLCCKYEMRSIIFGQIFWITFNCANIFSTAWEVVYSSEYILTGAFVLAASATCLIISSYTAIYFMFIKVPQTVPLSQQNYGSVNSEMDDFQQIDDKDVEKQDAEENKMKNKHPFAWITADRWVRRCIRAFVQNGVPFYATWALIATHLNVRTAMVSHEILNDRGASFVVLGVLTVIIFFYWYLDFYRLTRFLRYTYSPYLVLIVAFSGIVENGKLNNKDRPTSFISLILLILSTMALMGKIAYGCTYRASGSGTSYAAV